MSDETKITLSPQELAAALDTGFILTKMAVIEKTAALLNSLLPKIEVAFGPVFLQNNLPGNSLPKISKGENYNGYPYVILDHPALFGKTDVFAIRTMFWWGNFFSITLHVSGKYKQYFEERLIKNLLQTDLFIAGGEEEWQHHFEPGNFILFSEVTQHQLTDIISKNFLKVALKYDLNDWNNMQQHLTEGYDQVAYLLRNDEI
ncbi:MAG: hypothetical protein WKF88_11350 [Ferruginibacter sp.]